MQGLDFRIGPSEGRNLGPTDPLQLICREWSQRLGSDRATAGLGVGAMIQQELRTQDQTALRPKEKGLLIRGYEFPAPLLSQEPPFPLFFVRSLLFYILSSIHLPPTLVSHPCPYLSAHRIGYSFQHSVSCCGPHHTVQGSHQHQWGQGVSCGYLMRKGQLLLGQLFYHAPMADPLGSKSPQGSSRGLPLAMWCLPLL